MEGRDSLINILETWLLDDEQKQSLAAGTWNIFFLYATAYLLTFDGLTDNGNPWQKSSGLNSDRSARLTDYLGVDPAALGITDTRQAEIIEKILEGYISADRMGETIPPHLEYSSGQKIYIQSLAAGLRLAMGFNLSAPDLIPAIGIEFSPDLGKIIVRDNGIGMSRQWIEKYFLHIGLSFYQSDEILRVNRDASIQLSFISQFGIGFLSSFLVARQVIIKTR